MENLIIMGSGPAGLTAAIYASRSALEPVVIAGDQRGGQITLTYDMENFPGFSEGVTGFEFAEFMEAQARKFGARIEYDTVTEVDFSTRPFVLKTREKKYETRTIIIATGSSPRTLDVPGEKEYTGKGVSYCATCDGFFYKGKSVVVVGGGNSALEEGLYLTKFASKVTIVHRRDSLRADAILKERAQHNEKVDFIWDTIVTEVLGDKSGVTGMKLKNVKTEEEVTFAANGIFVYIGLLPNTSLFKGKLDLDKRGFIITDSGQKTSVDGVYAAGDVQDPVYKQAVTSAATGAIAAIEIERYIEKAGGKGISREVG